MVIPTNADFFRLCHEDHEFKMAARFWPGGIQFDIGETLIGVSLVDGEVVEGPLEVEDGVITVRGPAEIWDQWMDEETYGQAAYYADTGGSRWDAFWRGIGTL